MKFLCLECNQPMKLYESSPPDRGSIEVKYECPECLHQIAMLTNPLETQVVSSLGVSIGPEENAAPGATSKCPFAAKVAGESAPAESTEPTEGAIAWTDAARARLERIPAFVRPMAVIGIEQFARDNGHEEVDESILDQAKDRFGM